MWKFTREISIPNAFQASFVQKEAISSLPAAKAQTQQLFPREKSPGFEHLSSKSRIESPSKSEKNTFCVNHKSSNPIKSPFFLKTRNPWKSPWKNPSFFIHNPHGKIYIFWTQPWKTSAHPSDRLGSFPSPPLPGPGRFPASRRRVAPWLRNRSPPGHGTEGDTTWCR